MVCYIAVVFVVIVASTVSVVDRAPGSQDQENFCPLTIANANSPCFNATCLQLSWRPTYRSYRAYRFRTVDDIDHEEYILIIVQGP